MIDFDTRGHFCAPFLLGDSYSVGWTRQANLVLYPYTRTACNTNNPGTNYSNRGSRSNAAGGNPVRELVQGELMDLVVQLAVSFRYADRCS